MERNLFKFIWRYSKPQQLYLLVFIAISWPIGYLIYDIPKDIINRAIGPPSLGEDPPYTLEKFDTTILSMDNPNLFLLVLCIAFLSMVVTNNALKFHIGVYKGRLAERLLRRLRYDLYARILRFPLPHFKRVSQGELISMISTEAEQVGNFTGSAFVDPIFLGGQLVVTLLFILIQNPFLGIAALAFYPVQMYFIPKLQKNISQLAKQRLREVRRMSDHIGESVSGIVEVHVHDTAMFERSRFANRLGVIFGIRYEIFRRKFFIKFINNFIDKMAPFLFYLIGGFFVIQGELTIGALMAVIAAHKDMSAPWKEILNWYQQREDARVKYDQVVIQFDPEDMLDQALQDHEPDDPQPLSGDLELNNVGLIDEDGIRRLSNIVLRLGLDQHVAVVGAPNSGKDHLAMLLARLERPTSGRIGICGNNLAELPEAVTGRRISFVGANAVLQSATVRDNLVYALKHRPQRPVEYDGAETRRRQGELDEARQSGNTELDYNADWIDFGEVGVDSHASLQEQLISVLDAVDMTDDIYNMGLRGSVDPVARPDLADNILQARRALRDRLREPEYAELVEPIDRESYNTNASVAENLLFGTPVGDRFDLENLAANEYVLSVLRQAELYEDFLDVGRQVAETMVEIFADLPPGHEFFEQFSFIESDDLPEFQAILARAEHKALGELSEEDRAHLLSLPFKLVPARHRLGLIDESRRQRLLEARRLFARNLPDDLKGSVEFFDPERYNAAASLQDNILFGRVVYGQAQGAERIGALIAETLDARGLRASVMEVGLDFQVGVGGSRLSSVQRQKLAVARSILRRPDLLIVNEATAVLDPTSQKRLIDKVLELRDGKGVIWVLNLAPLAERFRRIVVMRDGRVVEQGSYAELNKEGRAFHALLQSA